MQHRPPSIPPLTGRDDSAEGAEALRVHQLVAPLPEVGALTDATVFVGFASDTGVARNEGRRGAADGPGAIRTALGSMTTPFSRPLYDAGDLLCVDDNLEALQAGHAKLIHDLVARGARPLSIGGGHEVAYGSWRGLANAHHQMTATDEIPIIGIINLDAHFDLRRAPIPTSGTPFRQIASETTQAGHSFRYLCLGISEFANTRALFHTAASLEATWVVDQELQHGVPAMLGRFLRGSDQIHLSLDLDVLSAAAMPAVSAPAPLGIPVNVVEEIIEVVRRSGKLAVADIAEFNPTFDHTGNGARLAARLTLQLAG
jgi:formiminoglutamase